MDVRDILASHRMMEMEETAASRGGVDFSEEIGSTFPPPELTRRYVNFSSFSSRLLLIKTLMMRHVNPNSSIFIDTSIVFSVLWYPQIRLVFLHFGKYVPRTLVNW